MAGREVGIVTSTGAAVLGWAATSGEGDRWVRKGRAGGKMVGDECEVLLVIRPVC